MSRRRWLLVAKGSAQIVWSIAFFLAIVAALAVGLRIYMRDHGMAP